MENERYVTIVALSKYLDIFQGFEKNLDEFAPGVDRVLVADGKLIPEYPKGWLYVRGPKKFSMAGNANLGWSSAGRFADILYIGDDVRLVQRNTVERLQELAYSDPNIGLLSPKILGGADNDLQTNPPTDKDLVYSEKYLALVCTYIKREVLDKVGYLDAETFCGYGAEDADFSKRVKLAGYSLAVAPHIEVKHGLDRKGTETFLRNSSGYYEDIQVQADANEEAYFKKWNERIR